MFHDRYIPKEIFKKQEELQAVRDAIAAVPEGTPLDDWIGFAKATKLKSAVLKKIRPYITQKDLSAYPIEGEADTDLRDTETVPFLYDGGINSFMENEVLTYAPDAWVDKKKTIVGYEISFSKYFYRPAPMRDMISIITGLEELEATSDGMLAEIMGGLMDEHKSI